MYYYLLYTTSISKDVVKVIFCFFFCTPAIKLCRPLAHTFIKLTILSDDWELSGVPSINNLSAAMRSCQAFL